MTNSLCRLSIQARDDGCRTVDLALPRDTEVGLLMPWIVDVVHHDDVDLANARAWRLSRITGQCVDETTTLDGNDIRDGELLVLTAAQSLGPAYTAADPYESLADLADQSVGARRRVVVTAVCVWSAVFSAVALVWSGSVSHSVSHMVTAAAMAASAAAAALVVGRTHRDPWPYVTLAVVAVILAACAGFLAVPASPSAASALLATACAFSTSTVLMRLTRCGTTCLVSLVTMSAIVGVALSGALAWTWPVEATGAVLTTLALTTLGVAARLSITLAGLAPSMPSAEGRPDEHAIDGVRADLAGRTLTGLAVGSSAAAALGTVLIAWSGVHHGRIWPSAAFSAVVGLALLLRVRSHADVHRRIALAAGGVVGVTAALATVVVWAPSQANWICAAIVGAGLTALCGPLGASCSPVARRVVDLAEYVSLALVVPLACWVGDLYGVVRGVSLR